MTGLVNYFRARRFPPPVLPEMKSREEAEAQANACQN